MVFPCSSYTSPIISVSFPYCFRIVSVFRYGINTETIRERYENDTGLIGGR